MISPTKKEKWDDKGTEIYGLSPVKKNEPALTTLSGIAKGVGSKISLVMPFKVCVCQSQQ